MTTKQEFLNRVWKKITLSGVPAIDAILDTALHANIDEETAARIVSGNAALKQLLQEEAIAMNTLKVKA